MRTRVIKWLLIISILLNVLFVLLWSWNMLNTPSNRLGRLEKGIRVGYFATDSVLFTLPKGLTVRDVSPVGLNAIGQFENNRFEIIITTELESLINYTLSQDSLDIFDNYYSADVLKYKN